MAPPCDLFTLESPPALENVWLEAPGPQCRLNITLTLTDVEMQSLFEYLKYHGLEVGYLKAPLQCAEPKPPAPSRRRVTLGCKQPHPFLNQAPSFRKMRARQDIPPSEIILTALWYLQTSAKQIASNPKHQKRSTSSFSQSSSFVHKGHSNFRHRSNGPLESSDEREADCQQPESPEALNLILFSIKLLRSQRRARSPEALNLILFSIKLLRSQSFKCPSSAKRTASKPNHPRRSLRSHSVPAVHTHFTLIQSTDLGPPGALFYSPNIPTPTVTDNNPATPLPRIQPNDDRVTIGHRNQRYGLSVSPFAAVLVRAVQTVKQLPDQPRLGVPTITFTAPYPKQHLFSTPVAVLMIISPSPAKIGTPNSPTVLDSLNQ
ncbi:hypothetical protein DFP72DRAFT_856049 [Ephemerocybe angulata]|uniref:Uncharacterized protein n=1 Tax=Ephemerocybe angulata TaxID=980116 RepID=A0A8H6LXI3_9AGAR|nr:hypothetical protein DFP72DRAFT_856049 [Tulosesus angulatus]